MIRVVIADNDHARRELIARVLETDRTIQVVGHARDGTEALQQSLTLRPDVVVMDTLVPVLDAVDATREIMTQCPTRVIVLSSTTCQEHVQLALDALREGAVMALPRPSTNAQSVDDRQSRELRSMVHAMSQVKVVRRRRLAARAEPRRNESVEVVTIAASTGGPEALRVILSSLPASFPAPILVVQHIAIGFTAGFATWLDKSCAVHVKLAADGERIDPGTVYIAPDNHHLGLGPNRTIALSAAPPIRNMRPSATHLFNSTASVGARQVAVILTGMGRDGVDGLAAVRAAGGRVIAQDEATSIVYGMPGEARAADVVDLVLPLHEIAQQLRKWCASE